MKEITIQIPDGKRAEWVNGVLTLVEEQTKDNRPVTERIMTLDDAINELGDDHPLVRQYYSVPSNEGLVDVLAYLSLRIIAAALNEGWEPLFTKDERRYYPYFFFYTQEEIDEMSEEEKSKLWLFGGNSYDGANCGLAGAASNSAWSASRSSISARLAVKSKDLAIHFGEQFKEIWADYIVLKRTCL